MQQLSTAVLEASSLQEVAELKGGCIVCFTAKWCRACVDVAPYFDSLAEQNQIASIRFVRVDVDSVPDAMEGVRKLPTFRGWVENSRVGEDARSAQDLKKLVEAASFLAQKNVSGSEF